MYDMKPYLAEIDRVIAKGPYKDTWESLGNFQVPEWYRNAKFGIFIHWGVYSVPSFGSEWYSRCMYIKEDHCFDHHVKTYGPHKEFGYKDFIPMFKAEKFSADAWADLFKKAGARYVVPVAEHHDGFAMYDTAFNRWNSVNMGPKTDVMARIRQACEENGLQFCLSSHRAEHYYFMNLGRTFDSDVNDPEYEDFYGPAVYREEFNAENMSPTTETPTALGPSQAWLEDWMIRTCELIDRCRPRLIYFDWWIQNLAFKPYLKKIAAYYYNRAAQWGVEVTMNYKREAFPPGVATFDVERGALTDISPIPWQTCTAIGKDSWGYTAGNEFKNSRQIICDLIDIVSKNGRMLLNVGPRADGTITEAETRVLKDLDAWMAVNGEGIHGTSPWKWFSEGSVNAQSGFFMDGDEKAFTGEDFRFTYGRGCIYVFQLRPDGKDVTIRTLAEKGMYDFVLDRVELLGTEEKLIWKRDGEGLHIFLPENTPTGLPLCFRIRML